MMVFNLLLCRNHRCQHGAHILLWIRDLLNGFKDISASSKDKFHAGVLINVTNQKLLMEEMCTKFDVMCRDRERHAVLKFLMHNL
jgi:hypothetical protein